MTLMADPDSFENQLGKELSKSYGTPIKPPADFPIKVNTEGEHTGKSVSYYVVQIEHPTLPRDKYTAECNDIIEALNMTYAEANVFKAIWRIAAARTLGKLKKGNSALYDAEKAVFFAERVLIQEGDKMKKG